MKNLEAIWKKTYEKKYEYHDNTTKLLIMILKTKKKWSAQEAEW